MTPSSSRNFSLLAIAVFVLGLLYFANSLGDLKQAKAKLASRTQTLEQLTTIKKGLHLEQQAIQAFKNLPQPEPSELGAIARAVFPAKLVEVRVGRDIPAAEGMVVRTTSVRLKNVSLGLIGQFLERASFVSPPWFLNSITIRAEDARGGKGKAVLEMTTFTQR